MSNVVRFRVAAISGFERFNVPTTCQCCGREDLLKTVKVASLDDGAVMWMGRGCAAKACGMGIKEFGKALKTTQAAQDTREDQERREANAKEDARWQAFLDARCPEKRGDRFSQIQALGGYTVANTAYKAELTRGDVVRQLANLYEIDGPAKDAKDYYFRKNRGLPVD
jgi:hypothetical protein